MECIFDFRVLSYFVFKFHQEKKHLNIISYCKVDITVSVRLSFDFNYDDLKILLCVNSFNFILILKIRHLEIVFFSTGTNICYDLKLFACKSYNDQFFV